MIKCDDEALAALLNTCDDVGEPDSDVAQHVESCQHCQSRLSELAADAEQWDAVSQWLSPSDVTSEIYAESLDARGRWKRPAIWTETMAKSLLSAASHPEMLGRIGRYDVERLIGSGGMGVVFKAYDTELNRPVAVKLLAPYLAGNGAARKRFAREARAAAAVVDDHVVPIHNVETEGEHPFLVMKYIGGGSLQQRLDREGTLEDCEVLRIGMQTAKGLAAAHAQGLIHRDVKPSNILLDEGVERALLTDFGLARAEDDACLTRSGFHPGTPHYMSPEQVRGEAIDGRSDLFGLGCVLYALCTGHPPFRAETSYAVLRRITDDTPRSIRETNPEIPAWLEQIVLKLLAKSTDERFESAELVAQLLEGCLAHVQQPTTTPLPESVAALAQRQSRHPPMGRFIAAAAFAFSLIFAGVLIVLELNKGTLAIESEAEDVPIRVMQGERVAAKLTVTTARETVRVAAGQYTVEVDGDMDGLVVQGESVFLKRGGTVTVKIVKTKDNATNGRPAENAPAALDPLSDLWHQGNATRGKATHWYRHWGFGPGKSTPDPEYIDPFRIGVSLGMPSPSRIPAYYRGGLEITRVAEGSPADRYGFEVGDVLLSWSGHQIDGDDPSNPFHHKWPGEELQRWFDVYEKSDGSTSYNTTFDLLDHRTGEVIQISPSFGTEAGGNPQKGVLLQRVLERKRLRAESLTPQRSLSAAVAEFNNLYSKDGRGRPQQPLTQGEITACLLWRIGNRELSDEVVGAVQAMLYTRGRQMPAGWQLTGGLKRRRCEDGIIQTWEVNLHTNGLSRPIAIRQAAIEPPESMRAINGTQEDGIETISLASVIESFNATSQDQDDFERTSHRALAYGLELPPLTIDEVLAAIALSLSSHDEADMDDSTFQRLQAIAAMHGLPADVRFEFVPSIKNDINQWFTTSLIRMLVPRIDKSELPYVLTVRRQFIDTDSSNPAATHWGKPGRNGLQAGFRLVPAQRTYQHGQVVDIEFLYRSTTSEKVPATLPATFQFGKVSGIRLERVSFVQPKWPDGSVHTLIGNEPVVVRGHRMQICFDSDEALKPGVNLKAITRPEANHYMRIAVPNPGDVAADELLDISDRLFFSIPSLTPRKVLPIFEGHYYKHWGTYVPGHRRPEQSTPDPEFIDPFQIGVSLGPADMSRIPAYYSSGMQVTQVAPYSPAESAGIEVGDILLSWEGNQIYGDDPHNPFASYDNPNIRLREALEKNAMSKGWGSFNMDFDLLDHRTGEVVRISPWFGSTAGGGPNKTEVIKQMTARKKLRDQ